MPMPVAWDPPCFRCVSDVTPGVPDCVEERADGTVTDLVTVTGAVNLWGRVTLTGPETRAGSAVSCHAVRADATPEAEPDTPTTANPAASATMCLRTRKPLARRPRARVSAEVGMGAGSAIGTRPSATSENTACGYATTSSDTANDARHSKPPSDSP